MHRIRHLTPDGFERTMAVNHFAPFPLTQALLDLVKASLQGRIITVSSIAHQSGRLDERAHPTGRCSAIHGSSNRDDSAVSRLGQSLFVEKRFEKMQDARLIFLGMVRIKIFMGRVGQNPERLGRLRLGNRPIVLRALVP